jgi:hypothetical protein
MQLFLLVIMFATNPNDSNFRSTDASKNEKDTVSFYNATTLADTAFLKELKYICIPGTAT